MSRSEGPGAPFYLELHDARLEDILLLSGAILRISFQHICSYHKSAKGPDEVWSARAVIEFYGVSGLVMTGTLGTSDYVSDGQLVDNLGTGRLPLLPVGELRQAQSFNLLLAGSGTELKLSMDSVMLVSLSPYSYLQPAPV